MFIPFFNILFTTIEKKCECRSVKLFAMLGILKMRCAWHPQYVAIGYLINYSLKYCFV